MPFNRFVRTGLAFAVPVMFVSAFLVQTSGQAAASTLSSQGRHATLFVSHSANTRHGDWSCQTAKYRTIQSAIDAAPASASVVVCPGTYHEQVVISKSLSVASRDATIEENGVTPSLVVSPPGVGPLTIFAGVVILASHVQFSGFNVKNSLGEGILAAGLTGSISDISISRNIVTNNDLGGGIPAKSTYFECQPSQQGSALIPNDCGEGIHLLSVAYSQIVHNTSSDNSGGILLTDESGPNHGNLVADNTVTNNTSDCGITVPGHNPNALSATGQPQPSVAGVYGNVIAGNRITGNGVQGFGAGVLFANASAGTASYDNLVVDNYIAGNGLDIPRLEMSSSFGDLLLGSVSPGDVLVVDGVVFEAAVEDPDEAVAEGSEGGVVGVTGGPVGVVERAGSG